MTRSSVVVSVLAEALVRWQHAAGPFWPYVCAAPFLGTGEGALLASQTGDRVSLSDQPPRRYSRRQIARAERLLAAVNALPLSRARGRELGGGGSSAVSSIATLDDSSSSSFPLIFADLPAEQLLAVAPLLAARGWYVVPVVQRWIATPAVLACRQLVRQLLFGAWQVRRPAQPHGAILIADGERTGPVGYPPLVAGRTFDNRYEYQICRFPSTRFLHAQGVRQVTWITTERPTAGPAGDLRPSTLGIPPVARDLHPYREMLLQADIDVAVSVWRPA